MEGKYEIVCDLLNGAISNDLGEPWSCFQGHTTLWR